MLVLGKAAGPGISSTGDPATRPCLRFPGVHLGIRVACPRFGAGPRHARRRVAGDLRADRYRARRYPPFHHAALIPRAQELAAERTERVNMSC